MVSYEFCTSFAIVANVDSFVADKFLESCIQINAWEAIQQAWQANSTDDLIRSHGRPVFAVLQGARDPVAAMVRTSLCPCPEPRAHALLQLHRHYLPGMIDTRMHAHVQDLALANSDVTLLDLVVTHNLQRREAMVCGARVLWCMSRDWRRGTHTIPSHCPTCAPQRIIPSRTLKNTHCISRGIACFSRRASPVDSPAITCA